MRNYHLDFCLAPKLQFFIFHKDEIVTIIKNRYILSQIDFHSLGNDFINFFSIKSFVTLIRSFFGNWKLYLLCNPIY